MIVLAALDEIVHNFVNLDVLQESAPLLRSGLTNTLRLVAAAFGVALVLGVPVTYCATTKIRTLRAATELYIDTMRATPPVIALLLTFYVLPSFHLPSLTAFQASVLAFGVIQSAYVGEVYRGVLQALSKGQVEAAHTVGLSWPQTARLIIAPQLVVIATPPLVNQMTLLVRDSALAFFIGYPELLTQARTARALTQNATPLFAVAVLYGVLLMTFQLLSNWLERHYALRR